MIKSQKIDKNWKFIKISKIFKTKKKINNFNIIKFTFEQILYFYNKLFNLVKLFN